MKDKIQQQQSNYAFQRSQILDGDVRDFLTQFDPARLANSRVAELFGGIHLEFECVAECEIPNHSELRILLRRLHAIWPWSGYFLDLTRPLGPVTGVNKTPLLAMALCVADRWYDDTQASRVIKPQLRRFAYDANAVIDRLAQRAGLDAEAIAARHAAVNHQFQNILQKI